MSIIAGGGRQFNSRKLSGLIKLAIDKEMFSGSADAGFVLLLPFHHGDIEPDCIGGSTRERRGLMRGIKIPPQDFALKMQGRLMHEGWAYLRDTTVYVLVKAMCL